MPQTLYDWPDYYDWTSPGLERDVTYYVELAKESGGPVLELGCGTGRISLAIAKEGIPVVGVDLSAPMLKKAEKKASEMGLLSHVRFLEADMTQLDLEEQFPLIIIPYRSFLHLLTVRDQINCLKRVRKHLSDEGVFAFNIFVPWIEDLHQMDQSYSYRGTFPVPGSFDQVELYDYTEYDYFHQTATIVRYVEHFDPQGSLLNKIRTSVRFRYIFPTEMQHLLNLCGFKVVHQYGSFHRTYFDSQSTELIIEAVKRIV
ncbi:class I SAM-dependent DNA methyltransferase [Hazenella coriacea]|uniref:Methyltransferase family protein n=1 Tax=Hazenella coriacea TaxID=1179467 RepID=A0A4R3L4C9_9BACL|nr:class I SAM-dependent methyltransferase [Hazenella coriacea]TCS92847.1 methyltransferase family protein [Hazenella coriacea]